jgi:two-component system NarL family sensor kinase
MSPEIDLYLVIISAILTLLFLVATIISLLFIYQSRQVRNRIEMKHIRDTYENAILATQLEIKEQTLHTIGQEIHDNVGQLLSLAHLTLSSIDVTQPESAKAKIENTIILIGKSVSDLRDLSRMLDPHSVRKQSLRECLSAELIRLEKTGRYRTQLEIAGAEFQIDDARKLITYRIIQEALTNVIRHSQATLVQASMTFSSGCEITIRDNGVGFDCLHMPEMGSGLRNMQTRARLMQGDLHVLSEPGNGTLIQLTIPRL